jgi:hypothetical protein
MALQPISGLGLLRGFSWGSVTAVFLWRGVVSPTPNPQPGGPGLRIYDTRRQGGPAKPPGTGLLGYLGGATPRTHNCGPLRAMIIIHSINQIFTFHIIWLWNLASHSDWRAQHATEWPWTVNCDQCGHAPAVFPTKQRKYSNIADNFSVSLVDSWCSRIRYFELRNDVTKDRNNYILRGFLFFTLRLKLFEWLNQ